ncbi:hypothetical protein KZX46_11550 [Polymorphobacter sp. PAMC 29334]|uniref:hypothetical protein n=1 Tax=Polymorphobacter sp. PAMC 29334 TaxID=2862331 RepID=UPI001C77026C|nr:hypothetical protein [Polymorphobacter sp. PAMC 29334]QYE36495.1 hypothetical protein KZX46_11550 [Polymorphobacter sp. PAMC 29334]
MNANLILASILIAGGSVAHAQSTAPTTAVAPADQAPPPSVTAVPAEPTSQAPAPVAADAATTTTAAAFDGVTKEGGKYMKDGRPATKTEIASYKKAEKARHE